MINVALHEKEGLLRKSLRDPGSVLVAYSGGVDSTFLLKFAIDTLGPDKVAAVTAVSDTYKPEDLEIAASMAKKLGMFEISIQKAACCKAVPKHPSICGHLEEVVMWEEKQFDFQ